jgi:hypothetical protein
MLIQGSTRENHRDAHVDGEAIYEIPQSFVKCMKHAVSAHTMCKTLTFLGVSVVQAGSASSVIVAPANCYLSVIIPAFGRGFFYR